MAGSSHNKQGLPEGLVNDLHRRLRWHGFWDSLLSCSPPLLAFSYLIFSFFYAGWIAMDVAVSTFAAGLGVFLGFGLYFGWVNLTVASVARLIDDRVNGKDRFVTLATIDPTLYTSPLIHRLRREATGFLDRINLKRDFPHRFKKSFFASLIVSVILVLLTQIILQTTLYSSPQANSIRQLSALARQLSELPTSAELGNSLMDLASQIREQGPLDSGNEDQIQNLLNQIQRQIEAGGGSGQGQSDLLRQAAGTLQRLVESMDQGQGVKDGLDMRPSGDSEGDGRKSTERGDEGADGNPSVVGKGEERGESTARTSMIRNERKPGQGDGGGRDKPGSENGVGRKEEDLSKAETGGKGTKEEQDKTPLGENPQRYYKADERGEKGIEGARYVIVELPDGAGASGVSVTSKSRKEVRGPKVPVSNIPLPPRSRRDAPLEKQRIPLEYRRMLR